MTTTATAACERQILFSGPMVRAILAGQKSQTRRVVKPQPSSEWAPVVERYHPTVIGRDGEEEPGAEVFGASDEYEGRVCPYGAPGDRLWVRETWAIRDCGNRVSLAPEAWPDGWPLDRLVYRADLPDGEYVWNLRPSIHMPRWASRLTLDVTGVRVARVQDISEGDAIAEGCSPDYNDFEWCRDPACEGKHRGAKWHFRRLWDSLNAARGFGWDANPWVFVIEFTPAEPASGKRARQQIPLQELAEAR